MFIPAIVLDTITSVSYVIGSTQKNIPESPSVVWMIAKRKEKTHYIYLSYKYSLFFPCFFYNGIYRIGVRLAALGQKLFCVNQLLGFAGLEQALNGGMCTDSQNYYWCCSPRRPRKFHSPVFKENSICKGIQTNFSWNNANVKINFVLKS